MSNFGLNGRLGNQMFQFAALYAAAKKLNTSFFLYQRSSLSASNYTAIDEFLQFDIENLGGCIWIRDAQEYQDMYQKEINTCISEPHFHYIKNFHNLPDQTDLSGYFQTEKYFKNHKDDISEIFSIRKPTKSFLNYKQLLENKHISLHIRRGDYVPKSDFHTNLAESDYYKDAISIMASTHPDAKYLVFSDDIEFCRSYFQEKSRSGIEFKYVTGTTSAEEIVLQSLCIGNVIANSSFSWWGAWLNSNNGTVIAPKNWFGPNGPKDVQDLFCEKWITL